MALARNGAAVELRPPSPPPAVSAALFLLPHPGTPRPAAAAAVLLLLLITHLLRSPARGHALSTAALAADAVGLLPTNRGRPSSHSNRELC